MNPVKRPPLRMIAENELNKHFGDIDTAVRNELATSLVRQWLTNDGHAMVVTSTHQFWFRIVARSDGCEVGFNKAKSNWGRILSQSWHVDEEEIPGLLHQLNLCQSVLCHTTEGRMVRLWIEPKERTVRSEEQAGEE